MPTAAQSLGMPRIRTDSHNTVITKQRVQRQLAAVVQLFEHKVEYLESLERSWIEYVTNEATLLTGDAQVTSWSDTQQGDGPGSLAMKQDSRGLSDVASEVDMNALLATSRNLNSVNNLLSCCYDRWLWLQSAQPQQITSSPDTDDLQELLHRHRQYRRQSNNVSSPPSEPMESSPRKETTSSASSRIGTMCEDGSEHSLSLAMDFTIERWRQNAEDALNEATTRLATGSNDDPQSPIKQAHHAAYTNSLHITKRGHPSLKVAGAVTAPHGCSSPTTGFTLGPIMSPTRHPTQPTSASYLDTAGTSCQHCSQEQTSTSRHIDDSATLRSTLRSTLHNSFDKEAVNYQTLGTPSDLPQHSARSANMYSGSLSERSCWLPQSHWPTSDLGLSFVPMSTDNTGRNKDTLQMSMSKTSLQSTTSGDTHVPRSRGRRWLEQQADRTGTG